MDKWLRNTNVVRIVALVDRDITMGCRPYGGDEPYPEHTLVERVRND